MLWERPLVLVELYGVERDRMAKVARSATGAGLQERQVRVVEHPGEILAAILECTSCAQRLARLAALAENRQERVRR